MRPYGPSLQAHICTFQSTHPHRVRRVAQLSPALNSLCFNPRTHIGCDLDIVDNEGVIVWFQSTHPHRVRQGFSCIARQATSFNPRTHIGCDLHVLLLCPRFVSFNPRTHIGCDLMLLTLNGLMLSFNPRTHIGCDFDRYDEPCQLYVSIHAPT